MPQNRKRLRKADLDRILEQPVLKTDFLKGPVIVESVELLKNGNHYLVRIPFDRWRRSDHGSEPCEDDSDLSHLRQEHRPRVPQA